jgi:ubiquitin C-terminal hydrolase
MKISTADADANKQVIKGSLKQFYKAYHDPKKNDEERLTLMQNLRTTLFDADLFEVENEQQDLHAILSQFLAILDNDVITKTVGKKKNKKDVESQMIELPALDAGKSLVSAMEEYLKDLKTLPRILPVVRQKEGNALDVSPNQTLEVRYGEDKKMNYKLKSFIVNQDKGSPYISYVRRGDQWYSIDNLTTKKISEEKLKKVANGASIFFYESN